MIGNTHAIFRWNGREDKYSVATIEDVSRNGTSVNGKLIGKGQTVVLRDMDLVGFGPVGCVDERKEYCVSFRYSLRVLFSILTVTAVFRFRHIAPGRPVNAVRFEEVVYL
jgi:hypothetical protein